MKSPVTGQDMKLKQELRSFDFRKESFEIVYHFYECETSGEQYTTNELDSLNFNQVQNQYRDKFNIPFPDEITAIRKKYGLTATKMSEVLGFGVNTYRQYESGDIPSVANAKLIQMVKDPESFIAMVQLCTTIESKLKEKFIQKAKTLLRELKENSFQYHLKEYITGSQLADIYSGYRKPNLEKFTQMVIYFSEKISPFKTGMNKLLFFSDFTMFKNTCYSISGMRYSAISMGPVPNNFQTIFEFLANNEDVDIHTKEFPEGYTGEKFVARKDKPFKPEMFSEKELKTLEKISRIFSKKTTKDLIDLSHMESAWKKNKDSKSLISYQYAFQLSNFQDEQIAV